MILPIGSCSKLTFQKTQKIAVFTLSLKLIIEKNEKVFVSHELGRSTPPRFRQVLWIRRRQNLGRYGRTPTSEAEMQATFLLKITIQKFDEEASDFFIKILPEI